MMLQIVVVQVDGSGCRCSECVQLKNLTPTQVL